MAYEWVDFDQAAIVRRYNRLARLIPFFEWVLFLPWGLRKAAVQRLELRRGDRVLEVGCGTGRNFPYLRNAVGEAGRIYGVDLSPGMLRHAAQLCDRQGWKNFRLTQADAASFTAGEPLDGVLFSLSCNTMPDHFAVLEHAWVQLRPGGRLVIMDAKLPPGLGGRLVLPFSLWLMKRTMLANPFVLPWEDVRELAGTFEWEEFLFGSYYICSAVKP